MYESLCLEDLEVGQSWISPRRTMTETDIVNFACATGDFNPLHVDHEHARETMFGRPIAHGLLGVAWVAGLGSNSPLVQTLAFVSIEHWNFLKPVRVGDTLHVETVVVAKEPSGRRAGRVRWRRRLLLHDGQAAQEGVFVTLVARRQRLKRPEA